MTERGRILLIYPQMGMSGAYVRHIPLSLLYAAVDSIKAGYAVDIVDTRLCPESWKKELAAKITAETVLAGISVITGTAVSSALEITRWLKSAYPQLPTLWGGPHASFSPEDILSEPSVDYVISGYGSQPLSLLAVALTHEPGVEELKQIPGLVFRDPETGTASQVASAPCFETIDYRDIPYRLIKEDLPHYGQLDRSERIFSIYSSYGCPYQCSFCSSPQLYRQIPCTYVLVPPHTVADHIEYLVKNYQATYIYFIDDDSFVNLSHVEAIIDEIAVRGLRVKLGFRGARIDEIMRMDDRYLAKLATAGTDILHIGAESGSERMLALMRKNITVADIIAVNRKLAAHPEIKAAYNWIVGLPGETLEDLAETRALVLQLIRENPEALIFPPNKYRPLPGTELYEAALRHGHVPPRNQDQWGDVEVEGDFIPPWYTPQFARMVAMMQVTAYFIDRKLFTLSTGSRIRDLLLRSATFFYRPLALYRYRHGATSLLFEHWLYLRYSKSFRD